VVKNFLVLANWHLFAYLALVAAGVATVTVVRRRRNAGCGRNWCLSPLSLMALFVLFFLTDAQRWGRAVHQHQPGVSGFRPGVFILGADGGSAPHAQRFFRKEKRGANDYVAASIR